MVAVDDTKAVGKDVAAMCRKCGDVWHVIVAMADGEITKVQCKECDGYHRYRAPPGEKPKRKIAAKKTTKKKTAKKKTRRKKGDLPPDPQIDPDLSKPVRDYSMRDTFEPGERIEHVKFGQGVVESLPGPGKMTVFFEEGRRTLAHGR